MKDMQTISKVDNIIFIPIKNCTTEVDRQRENSMPTESLPSAYLTKAIDYVLINKMYNK